MNLAQPIDISVDQANDLGWEKVRKTLIFLAIPGLFLGSINLLDLQVPKIILYGTAGIIGLTLAIRSLKDPEWLIATTFMYLPLSKSMVIPIAPMVNGTNMLIMLMGISLLCVSQHDGKPMLQRRPGTRIVAWLFAFTVVSGITMAAKPGGVDYMLNDVIHKFKGMLDQWIYFLIVINLIRDSSMARRVAIYMVLSGVLIMLLGFEEMIEKMGRSSIEKSRVDGPHIQANDFGAFLVYSLMPLLGIFLMYITRVKTWILFPYFFLGLKVLLATFSRGAYLALGAGGLIAGYLKGKGFLFLGIVLAAVVLISAPQLIPDSMMARFENTLQGDRHGRELDRSSEMRVILWKAAVQVTLENPVLGAGFESFPLIKAQYTEEHVRVSDPHNMYLWFSAQAGIPAMITYCLLLWTLFKLGYVIYRRSPDRFTRAMGIAGSAMAVAASVINMFGSRGVDLNVNCILLAFLAILSHIYIELPGRDQAEYLRHEPVMNTPK